MRLLASADLHGRHSVYEWLVRTASEQRVDAIVLAGVGLIGCLDGFATPEAAQEHEALLVSGLLGRGECPVLYIGE
jgi:Icc-related predicted phosphoesterase